MPTIPTYTSEQPVAQANNMVEEAFLRQRQNAARIGGAISDLADTGYGVVRRIEENRALEESTNLAADLATTQADLQVKLEEAKKNADPNSEGFKDWQANFMSTVVDPAVDKLGSGLTTRQAQRQLKETQAKLRGMFYVKTNADQADLSGAAAVDNIKTLGNVQAASVYANPATFDISIGIIDHSIQGLVDAGLPLAQANEIKRDLHAQVAESAFRSAAELNPDKAQKDLDAGRYAPYLPEGKQEELRGYIDRQRRIAEVDKERQLAAEEKAKRDASEAAYQDLTQKIIEDPTKLIIRGPNKDPAIAALSGQHAETFLRLYQEQMKKVRGDKDPDENKGPGFWNTYQAVIRGEITDPLKVYELAGPGRPLTMAGANALFEVAKKVREGPNKGDFETQKLAKFDAEIHRQITAPDGIQMYGPERNTAETNYTRAWFDSRKAIEEGKRKGLSLDEMLDDRSPNYIMKNLQAYKPAREALRYPGTNPGEKFDLKTLDTQFKDGREGMTGGLKALQDAVAAYRRDQSTGISPEQAIGYARRRGWGIVKKPAIAQPPTIPPAR